MAIQYYKCCISDLELSNEHLKSEVEFLKSELDDDGNTNKQMKTKIAELEKEIEKLEWTNN